VVWMAVVWATVHIPGPFHSSFLFVAYVIALLANTPREGERPWLPSRYVRPVLFLLLAMQIPISVHYSVEECLFPFSGAKATAEWLKSSGFASRPLVIEPDTAAPAIIAYTGVQSAYFPASHCHGSFVVFRRGREEYRQVTVEELRNLRQQSAASPVVVSHQQLPSESLKLMGIQLLYTSPHGMFWPFEDVFVYGDNSSSLKRSAGRQ